VKIINRSTSGLYEVSDESVLLCKEIASEIKTHLGQGATTALVTRREGVMKRGSYTHTYCCNCYQQDITLQALYVITALTYNSKNQVHA